MGLCLLYNIAYQSGHFAGTLCMEFDFLNKKRHIPKMCQSLRLVLRYNTHKTGMCQTKRFGHTDPKGVL